MSSEKFYKEWGKKFASVYTTVIKMHLYLFAVQPLHIQYYIKYWFIYVCIN